jgi:hypothetical protein
MQPVSQCTLAFLEDTAKQYDSQFRRRDTVLSPDLNCDTLQDNLTEEAVRHFFYNEIQRIGHWVKGTTCLRNKIIDQKIDGVTAQRYLNIAKTRLIKLAIGAGELHTLVLFSSTERNRPGENYSHLYEEITADNVNGKYNMAMQGVYRLKRLISEPLWSDTHKVWSRPHDLWRYLDRNFSRLFSFGIQMKYELPLLSEQIIYSFSIGVTALLIGSILFGITYYIGWGLFSLPLLSLLKTVYRPIFLLPIVGISLIFYLFKVFAFAEQLFSLNMPKMRNFDASQEKFRTLADHIHLILKKFPFFRNFVEENGDFIFFRTVEQKMVMSNQNYYNKVDVLIGEKWNQAMRELVNVGNGV